MARSDKKPEKMDDATAAVYALRSKYRIDPETVHQVMLTVGGVKSKAAQVLRDGGVNITDEEFFELFNRIPKLKAVWDAYKGNANVVTTSPPETILDTILPAQREEMERKAAIVRAEREEAFLAAQGLEGLGYGPEEMEQAMSWARFGAKTFTTGMAISHGLTIDIQMRLFRRLEEIRANYLDNNEVYTEANASEAHPAGTPVIPDAEKMKWQSHYNALAETIGKNNAAIFQSGELLMNVMNAGKQNHSGPVPTKKARRVVT